MLWDINEIQFARLIDEIIATQTIHLSVLADSMDLELHDVDALINRANEVWEKSKADVQVLRRVEKECQALVKLNEKLNEKIDAMMIDHQALSDHNRELIDHNDGLKKRIIAYQDESNELNEKNQRLTKELNAEFERYAKLDDVRYELETKLKAVEKESDNYVKELGKLRKLIASYKDEQGDLLEQITNLRNHNEQLIADVGRLETEMGKEPDPELYFGPPPYFVQSPGCVPFQEYIHGLESAYQDYGRAVAMGIQNPRVINRNEEDITDAICKKFEDDGAE